MNAKGWGIFAGVVVLLLGGLIYFSTQNKLDVGDISEQKLNYGLIDAEKRNGDIGEHVYGKKDSKVVLIEYGDYQCPGCGSAYETIHEVTEKYKDKIAFVFRNFPLVSIHPNARAAASAAEAAGLQGKYWEMHDKLYVSQDAWSNLSIDDRTTTFANYAEDLGLNVDQFKTDMASQNVTKKIDFDMAVASRKGVKETPYFYLNNEPLTQTVKDGKIVAKGTDGSSQIWVNADALENLVIKPALKKAGISTDDIK